MYANHHASFFCTTHVSNPVEEFDNRRGKTVRMNSLCHISPHCRPRACFSLQGRWLHALGARRRSVPMLNEFAQKYLYSRLRRILTATGDILCMAQIYVRRGLEQARYLTRDIFISSSIPSFVFVQWQVFPIAPALAPTRMPFCIIETPEWR